jgi:hypothetical protein
LLTQRKALNIPATQIQEIYFQPNKTCRKIVFHHLEGDCDRFAKHDHHVILRISFAGEIHAMDLSGAQYGHH